MVQKLRYHCFLSILKEGSPVCPHRSSSPHSVYIHTYILCSFYGSYLRKPRLLFKFIVPTDLCLCRRSPLFPVVSYRSYRAYLLTQFLGGAGGKKNPLKIFSFSLWRIAQLFYAHDQWWSKSVYVLVRYPLVSPARVPSGLSRAFGLLSCKSPRASRGHLASPASPLGPLGFSRVSPLRPLGLSRASPLGAHPSLRKLRCTRRENICIESMNE